MKHSLKDAYIYDLLGLDTVVTNIGVNINPKLDKHKITQDQLNMILNDFKYKATGYGKERIISQLLSGKLVLVYAKGVPLPAWCMLDKGEVIGVINIFSKVRVNREGNLAYQVKELFGLCVAGYALRTFHKNEKKLMFNTQFITTVGAVYTRMIATVLDNLFAASSDPNTTLAMSFLPAKFYLRRVMECNYNSDTELSMILNILRTSGKGQFTGSPSDIVQLVKDFPEEGFESIDKFCVAMAASFPLLARLETNLFIRKMITTFGEKSALMLESPQYLTAYIFSTLYSANLLRDFYFSMFIPQAGSTKLTSTIFSVDPDE